MRFSFDVHWRQTHTTIEAMIGNLPISWVDLKQNKSKCLPGDAVGNWPLWVRPASLDRDPGSEHPSSQTEAESDLKS